MRSLFTPTVRRLIGLMREHRRGFIWSILAALGSIAAGLILPLVQRSFINSVLVHHDRGAILPLSGLLLVLAIARAFMNFLRRNLAGSVSVAIETSLRDRLYAHLQGLPVAFHDEWQTGQLLARAIGDMNAVRMFLAFGLVFLGILVVMIVGTVALLFSLDWALGLVVVVLAPSLIMSVGAFNRRVSTDVEASRELTGDLSATVEESASGIRVLKAFGRESTEVARLQALSDELWETNVRVARIRSRWVPLLGTLPNLMMAATLAFGGYRVLHGALDVGSLFAAYQYLGLLAFPLRNVGWILTMGQQADAAGKRIFEVLDTEPTIVDGPDELPRALGKVELRGVKVQPQGSPRPALDGIDLVIEPGQCVAFVGASGSGKSVLGSLLWRARDPDEGVVLLDDHDLRTATLHSLRAQVGVVFDEAVLFRGTLRDNVAFGDPDATDELVTAAAVAAGADEVVAGLPEGWQTRVGENGFSLSGGQRQRVALARALLTDPRLLILDDPLSAVDPRTERRIEASLAAAISDRTTVLIAHRASTIRLAHRVVVLDAGRIVADGTHEELLETSSHYRSLLASAEADAEVASRAALLLDELTGGVAA